MRSAAFEVALLRSSVVIPDDVGQCAKIGDLHHAIDAGAVAPSDVRATLDQVVAGVKPDVFAKMKSSSSTARASRSKLSP